MCNKKHLILSIQRSILNLKNLRFLFFIPILLMDVILPILLINSYKTNGVSEEFLVDIQQYCFMILPISSICWSIFSMKDYVGEIGSEILYISYNKIKINDFLLLLIYAFFNMSIIAVITCCVINTALPIFISTPLISIFLFGLSYFLLFYTKSLTIVIMIDLLYIISSLILGGRYTIFPLYVINQVTYTNLCCFYLPLGIIGVFLCILGIKKNKHSCI